MVIHFPSDIELYEAFRRLREQLGNAEAQAVMWRMFIALAYDSQQHGVAGRISNETAHRHLLPLDVLTAAGWLRQKTDYYLCPIFSEFNWHLDGSYIPPTFKYERNWRAMWEKMQERSEKLSQAIDRACWFNAAGEVLLPEIMNRALVLIRTLDLILERNERSNRSYTPGLVQSSVAVVSKVNDAKLSLILKRFLAKSRPSLSSIYPRTTEECLSGFDDLSLLLSPDEGYERWVERMEDSRQTVAISEEVAARA